MNRTITKMKIEISKLVDNRFRDFEIDPIDDKQVERLAESIDQLGFFSGITVRRLDDGTFEVAAGHHRVVAANKAGHTHVEAVVGNYTDEEMVRIMAIENLTQRGANTGAQMDAVGATARIVSKEILSDRSDHSLLSERFGLGGEKGLDSARVHILNEGPGEPLIYRVINGFDRTEVTAQDPKTVMIGQGDVKNAIKRLKDSGRMAKIVAAAYAEVEAEREEDAAKAAEAERKAEAKRKEAEAKATAELKLRQAAEEAATRRAEEARKTSEAARKAAERASAERKAEADRKAKAAKEAADRAQEQRRADAEARRRAEQAQARARQAEAERQAEAARKRQAQAEREANEKAKVKAQQAREAVYDVRCDTLFPDPEFARAFFRAVTSRGAAEVIARNKQWEVAKAIVQGMKDMKAATDHKAGTVYISNFVTGLIEEHDDKMRKHSAAEQETLRRQNQILRVDALWNDVNRGMTLVETSMQKLMQEHKTWDRSFGDFPANVELASHLGITARVEEMLLRMFPDHPGVKRWTQARQEGGRAPDQKLIKAS